MANFIEVPYTDHLFDHLNGEKMVSLGDNSYFQDLVDHTFEDRSIHLNKTIKTNSFVGAAQLAMDGFGITVTLANTLQYALPKGNYNIVRLPLSLLNLDTGISVNGNASAQINNVANTMIQIIRDIGYQKL